MKEAVIVTYRSQPDPSEEFGLIFKVWRDDSSDRYFRCYLIVPESGNIAYMLMALRKLAFIVPTNFDPPDRRAAKFQLEFDGALRIAKQDTHVIDECSVNLLTKWASRNHTDSIKGFRVDDASQAILGWIDSYGPPELAKAARVGLKVVLQRADKYKLGRPAAYELEAAAEKKLLNQKFTPLPKPNAW